MTLSPIDQWRICWRWFGQQVKLQRGKVAATAAILLVCGVGMFYKQSAQNGDRIHDIKCEGRTAALRFRDGLHQIAVALEADPGVIVVIDGAIDIPDIPNCPTP